MLHKKCGIVLLTRTLSACIGIVLLQSLLTTVKSTRGLSYAAIVEQSPITHEQNQSETAAAFQTGLGMNLPRGMTVFVMSDAIQFRIAIKVGEQVIQVPGPSSWPQGAVAGNLASNEHRFLAALIDTADILKANGYPPDSPFSFVINGVEMNPDNFHPIAAGGSINSVTDREPGKLKVESKPTEVNNAWRAYEFRNIVLSQAQTPTLEDFLVPTKNLSAQTGADIGQNGYTPAASNFQSSKFTPIGYGGALPRVTPLEEPSPQNNRKYINALNSPDPSVRADAIENLILNGYQGGKIKQGNTSLDTTVEKDASSDNAVTNDKYLDSADQVDKLLPQETLSDIALHDMNPVVRIRALDNLVERFGQQAAPTLKQSLNDPDPRVARLAAALMSDLEDSNQ